MGLHVMRLYVFACDQLGCDAHSEEVLPAATEPDKATWARRYLARDGWTFHGRRSFCPDHRPEE